ncbi:MAG: winged helix-turn-helix domain-containing protein, partial [Vicinamibacterales bacterium]
MTVPPASSRIERPLDSRGFVLGGRWRIFPDLNRVRDGEVEQQIPDKLMQVLMVLAARGGGVVSRRELFDQVWPDTVVVEEALTRVISGLRKLFDDDPSAPRIIETIPKKGYRLLASVEALEPEAADLPQVGRVPVRTHPPR